MFSSTVMTVFSSLRKLYLVLLQQNQHQLVTIAVTRLLVHQAWCLAIPATANQAAQTQLRKSLCTLMMARHYTDC